MTTQVKDGANTNATDENLTPEQIAAAKEAEEKLTPEEKEAAAKEKETADAEAKEKQDAKNKEAADKTYQDRKDTEKTELLKYEKTDLVLPKDSQLSEAHLEQVAVDAKKLGLGKEEAQALLERDNAMIVAHQEAQTVAKDKVVDQWLEDVKEDTELGGTKENTEATAIRVKKVVDRFGSKALKEKLVETGLGNHPELVRFFNEVGKSMTPEQLVLPGSGAPKPKEKTPAEKLYGPKE